MAGPPGIWTHDIPNRTPSLVIVSIVFLIITTPIVCVRFVWRTKHRQRGFDDFFALCAYLLLLIMTVFLFLSAHYGFGKHLKDIKPTLHTALLYFYLYQIGYKILGGLTKLTFCFLYLRIFNQKRFTGFVIAISTIVALGSLAFALGTVFQCNPVNKAWNRLRPGTCISNTGFWFSHAAFNTFMDIIVYITPIPMISTLKLARGQKTGLISIFCFGAFVIAASVVRMVELRSSATTPDQTYGSANALMWTEIEANTSVIICCMPALRVPALNLWHRIRGCRNDSVDVGSLPQRQVRESAWQGPHVGIPEAHCAPTKPSKLYQSNTSRIRGKGKSSQSSSNGSKSAADSWLEKVLHSFHREEQRPPLSRTSSQDELACVATAEEGGMPPERMELGAIYKTTDVHISTTDRERQLSLQDFLDEQR